MGVPVVTLAGQTHAARVGASLLTNAGFAELIASTPDLYVEIATARAGEMDRLRGYRGDLRQRLLTSPLLDARGHTKGLEDALLRHTAERLNLSVPKK